MNSRKMKKRVVQGFFILIMAAFVGTPLGLLGGLVADDWGFWLGPLATVLTAIGLLREWRPIYSALRLCRERPRLLIIIFLIIAPLYPFIWYLRDSTVPGWVLLILWGIMSFFFTIAILFSGWLDSLPDPYPDVD